MKKTLLSYLNDLEKNNDREWYHSHKMELHNASREFEGIIERLLLEIGKFDSGILLMSPFILPKNLTFKLVRDTRFSHDKSPYNPSFRCHLSAGGKTPIPVGYFLSIRANNQSFLGGGLFAHMFKDATNMIRAYINDNSQEFYDIINAPEFIKNFKVKGESLKRVPREYDPEHQMAEYIKHKSWYIEHAMDDGLFEDYELFIRYAVKKYLIMKPFNDFINKALTGFKMPEKREI